MLTILCSILNMIREPIRPLNKPKNLHFDNEKETHMRFKSYEVNGYDNYLALIMCFISCKKCV